MKIKKCIFSWSHAGEAGGARIVLIGSVVGLVSFPFYSAYCATKHAIEAIADGLRRELAPWKILVSVIEPGSFATKVSDEIDIPPPPNVNTSSYICHFANHHSDSH